MRLAPTYQPPAPLSQRLNKKAILGSLCTAFTVPPGVDTLYLTGAAAGGRCYASPSNPFNYNWTPGVSNVAIGCSPSGAAIATNHNSSATTAVVLDAVGQKVSSVNGREQNSIAAYNGGYCTRVADNGFVVCSGSSYGYWSADFLKTRSSLPTYASRSGIAMKPVARTAATADNRAAFASAATLYWFDGQGGWRSKSDASLGGQCFRVNGYFVAPTTTGGRCKIHFRDENDATATDWTTALVEDVAGFSVLNIDYANGLYVATGTSGKIWTAATLAGPWTARNSGLASNIYGLARSSTKWVALDSSGSRSVATDPTGAWTVTAGANQACSYQDSFRYDPFSQLFWVTAANGYLYYSANGADFSSATTPENYTYAIALHPLGLLCVGSGYFWLQTGSAAYRVFSTSYDGGPLVVRDASGAELYRLAGGLQAGPGTGGSGGSSEGRPCRGQQYGRPAPGLGGSGGVGTTIPGFYPGGLVNNASDAGGGAAIQLSVLIANEGLYGVKQPGGAGAGSYNINVGAGASIFSPALTGDVEPPGPGGGMPSVSSSADGGGGAGEGVVRAAISVTPGQTIYVSPGLAHGAYLNGKAPQDGFCMLEWEERK